MRAEAWWFIQLAFAAADGYRCVNSVTRPQRRVLRNDSTKRTEPLKYSVSLLKHWYDGAEMTEKAKLKMY